MARPETYAYAVEELVLLTRETLNVESVAATKSIDPTVEDEETSVGAWRRFSVFCFRSASLRVVILYITWDRS